ncbi:rop guanine nucleotide exchange factor 14-like [Bidens hawaiensis]|uniref:rop guanine nucleotide exchange factor 14-like n=1 Tax=Bidens hawaiensis TaxID=980011 RepID=UPI00404A578D
MVLLRRRRLACFTSNKEMKNSIDFDQRPANGIMTYNSCILSADSCEDESVTSGEDEGPTLDYYASVNEGCGSLSSDWMITKDEALSQISHVEIMKETFAKLLLGEDTTGGSKGHSSALALSNSITKLARSVFGELWKLEPLSEEKKNRWITEMEWFLAPTSYMVELVPAKQYGANGHSLEIMTRKAREDIGVNLLALQKLDYLLLEVLDAMTKSEFWYDEGSRSEGNRWWVPMPRVPIGGLSNGERKKLLNQAKLVHQIFKAAKSINETILPQMPVPNIIREALPKSGKANLGDDLYRTLNTTSSSRMLNSLKIMSEHSALDIINKLEAAIYSWKERISTATKSTPRTLWSLKDSSMEVHKIEFQINRAEVLMQQIRNQYPNLPQTFLDVMKVQHGKDIAYAILEAYSRVLGSLAFNMLARIEDICQEDLLADPNSPLSTNSPLWISVFGISGISMSGVTHTL